MKAVFGFVMYGIPNPYDQGSTAAVLYTNGELPTTGRPTELVGATVLEIVAANGLPGFTWGADPRHPISEDSEAVIKLEDDEAGTLGTLFLDDPSAAFWGCETNRLSTAGTALSVVGALGANVPVTDYPYFLGNECMSTELGTVTAHGTADLTLTRARCGSVAKAHVLRPSDYSIAEDGTEDRLYLRAKPDWGAGFFCGVYCFLLDHNGAIASYVLRRGIVLEEPTPTGSQYEIRIKFLEGAINTHQVGETSKETTLELYILVTKLTAARPQEVSFLLKLKQAEAFFNEPLAPRGGSTISAAAVSNLQTRMKADPQITYEIKLKNDFEWVYKVNALSVYYWNSNGVAYQAVKVTCSLQPDGYTSDGTALHSPDGYSKFRPWYQNSIVAGDGTTNSLLHSGGYQGIAAPTITLRVVLRKTVVKAFLTLCCSNDGSSGATYDKLIGGVGASLPQAFFSVGTASGTPLASVLGNTSAMAQLDELLNPLNVYYFDLSQGVSLKDFLTNEFIASQLLCGSLQSGLLSLKAYVHEVAASVTLQPLNRPVKPGQKLSPIKRLDLSSGTRVLTLEPLYRRSVRYLGTTTVKEGETQALRFWREGLNLSVTDITSGDLALLVRAFYKLFGGAPRVYDVTIALEDYVADAIEFGDAVLWSNTKIPTPSGLGIDDDFYVVGVDLDFDNGEATLKLLQNTLTTAPTVTQTGKISPTLKIAGLTTISPTVVQVDVERIDGIAFDYLNDFDGIFDSIAGAGGYLKVDNYDHAPIGEKERIGSVEAIPNITGISVVGPVTTIELTFDASFLRGSVTAAADLITVGETKLNLPARVTAENSLPGTLIEAVEQALPSQNNFINFQPVRPLNGATHTFKV